MPKPFDSLKPLTILIFVVLIAWTGLATGHSEPLAPNEQAGDATGASDLKSTLDLSPYFPAKVYPLLNAACDTSREAFDMDDCVEATRNAYNNESNEPQKIRLGLLLGLRAFDVDNYTLGTEAMTAITGRYPLMQDYIFYYRGEAAYQTGAYGIALPHFSEIKADSRLYVQARFRAAFCKSKLKHADAADILDELLTLYPDHFRTLEAKYELAQRLRGVDKNRAATLLRTVMIARPLVGLGKLAEDQLFAIPGQKPGDEALAKLRIAQAESLIDAYQYRDAERLIRDTIRQMPEAYKKHPIRRQLLVALGKAQFKRRQYTDAIDTFDHALANPLPDNDRAAAMFWRMDALMRKGETDPAIAAGQRFLAEFPGNGHACSVRHMIAKAHKVEDRFEQALPLYQEIAQLHPQCSHVPTALWNVGWLHFKRGQYDPAKAAWSRIATTSPSRFERERALYWLARIADLQGFDDYASDLYTLCAKRYPLSYYPNLALQRLTERDAPLPEPYQQKEDLSDLDVTVDLAINVAPYRGDSALHKGEEFIRLGRKAEATREFKHLQSNHADDLSLSMLVAYMYHLAEDWPHSIWLFRTRLEDFADYHPLSPHRSPWLMAYPRPFWPQVQTHSAAVGLDPLILMGLMREESSFQTDASSYAHAVGLTQIIYSTGRHIANQLKVQRFRLNDLVDPNTSIRFGAFHIDELIERYNGNHALAISAYNAGETNVNRWLRAAKEDVPMDIFIEDIPYRQTRHYTRRVLKSYGIYRHLYTADKLGFDLWQTPRRHNATENDPAQAPGPEQEQAAQPD